MPDTLETKTSKRPSSTPESNTYTYTYTLNSHPQVDLELIGMGASSKVYKVNDQIILKAPQIYEEPDRTSSEDRQHYVSDTIFHANLLQNERTVLQLLQQHPHPHLVQAIAVDYNEGLYLRKYSPLSLNKFPSQSHRCRLYSAILNALAHLHSFGIVHGDVRLDNIVLDEDDTAILCDFSASSPFGLPNLVFPHFPLPVNGPSMTLSPKTDLFALASLVYQAERGVQPELSLASDGRLLLPEIGTSHVQLDSIIRRAWLGQYSDASEMQGDFALLAAGNGGDCSACLPLREDLRHEVRIWREARQRKFGSVLAGLPSEEELHALAVIYGHERDADFHFANFNFSNA